MNRRPPAPRPRPDDVAPAPEPEARVRPAEATPRARDPSLPGRILREPTVHFVLLAGALFAASAALRADGEVVTVPAAEVTAQIAEAEAWRGSPLTPEERRRVEDNLVDRQILAREARALGLDDDPRIDDLLAQKMLHVLSGGVIQPSEAELEAYWRAHRERYAPEPALTLEERVLAGPGEEGGGAGPAVAGARTVAGPGGRREGSSRILADVGAEALVGLVGPELARRLSEASLDEWIGPRITVRGHHWFRVRERSDDTPPPLEVVREQVRRDWVEEREAERLERRVAELRSRYSVVVGGEVRDR